MSGTSPSYFAEILTAISFSQGMHEFQIAGEFSDFLEVSIFANSRGAIILVLGRDGQVM